MRRLWWRRAAVRRDPWVRRWRTIGICVAPLAECELAAWAVAAHGLLSVRVQHLQVHVRADVPQVLRSGALVEGELGAVDRVRSDGLISEAGRAVALHLELERQGEAIDQADVDPVLVRAERGLKLGVHRGSATGSLVAHLLRPATLADLASVALLVAPQLGPVPRASEPVKCDEIVGLQWLQPHVLRVGTHARGRHVGDPERLIPAAVGDAEPRRWLTSSWWCSCGWLWGCTCRWRADRRRCSRRCWYRSRHC
mmetsp:Transcript_97837/g.237960  ORF Transcript_97837/g.237960 Transcript_97837/m.237960 type:complete len:254 (-) Transcript_97837:91-852(-)